LPPPPPRKEDTADTRRGWGPPRRELPKKGGRDLLLTSSRGKPFAEVRSEGEASFNRNKKGRKRGRNGQPLGGGWGGVVVYREVSEFKTEKKERKISSEMVSCTSDSDRGDPLSPDLRKGPRQK